MFSRFTCRITLKLAAWRHPGAHSRVPNPVPASRPLSSVHTGLGVAQKSGHPEHMRLGMKVEILGQCHRAVALSVGFLPIAGTVLGPGLLQRC